MGVPRRNSISAMLGQRTARQRDKRPTNSTSPSPSAMAPAIAAEAMVPSKPLPKKAQVVGQAKKFHSRACN